MTTIQIDSDVLSANDLNLITLAVQHFVPKITTAVGKPAVTVTTAPTPGAWQVHLTEKNRHTGAAGYHVDENGTIAAYCSPRAAGRLWGHYTPALWTKPTIVKGKVVIPAKQIHGELYTPGLVTVICHEIAEMLSDENITNYTAPNAKGESWLLEVCDWVFGQYFHEVVGGQVCVYPNVALDNYHTLGAPAPYDLLGKVTAPFQLIKPAYAYKESPTGPVPVVY